MKNLILIIATGLVSLLSFSQDQVEDIFAVYGFSDDSFANAYEKIYYESEKDGNPITYFWGYYTDQGIDIIVEEANRILKLFNAEDSQLFERDDFLIDGMFDAGEGDGNIYKVTFSDGSWLKIGAYDADEYNPEWGHLKVMELCFKHKQK